MTPSLVERLRHHITTVELSDWFDGQVELIEGLRSIAEDAERLALEMRRGFLSQVDEWADRIAARGER